MAKYRPAIPNSRTLPDHLKAELRVSHAGEVGAVAIYQGMMLSARSTELQQFARRHKSCEERHLSFFENHVSDEDRTKLLPIWQLAGFGLGVALGSLGKGPTKAAIQTVEDFVSQHYRDQIEQLREHDDYHALANRLEHFVEDEQQHAKEAEELGSDSDERLHLLERIAVTGGNTAIKVGSRIAVALTRLL